VAHPVELEFAKIFLMSLEIWRMMDRALVVLDGIGGLGLSVVF
jgi:hypothetical protein